VITQVLSCNTRRSEKSSRQRSRAESVRTYEEMEELRRWVHWDAGTREKRRRKEVLWIDMGGCKPGP
jgi:primase-polymerase (primpol)-like protein